MTRATQSILACALTALCKILEFLQEHSHILHPTHVQHFLLPLLYFLRFFWNEDFDYKQQRQQFGLVLLYCPIFVLESVTV